MKRKRCKLAVQIGIAIVIFFAAISCSDRAVKAETAYKVDYTAIDGEDGEYWKYFDAEGNRISHADEEDSKGQVPEKDSLKKTAVEDEDSKGQILEEEGPKKQAIEEDEISLKSPYTQKSYVIPEGYTVSHGIDVSVHQGKVDWSEIKSAGIESVMIRCGYRGYESGRLEEDKNFKQNIDGALKAGLRVGVYIFSQAIDEDEAKEEAKFCLQLCEPYLEQLDMPIVMDAEYVSTGEGNEGRLYKENLSVSEQTELCRLFCRVIADGGYQPMVYANKSFLTSEMDPSVMIDCGYHIWLARYGTDYDYKKSPFLMWQYAKNGQVDGVDESESVDVNFILEKNLNAAPVWTMNKLSDEKDCVTLRWAPAAYFARKFQIERRIDGGDWKLLKTVEAGAALRYKDYNMAAGSTYEYRMRACYLKNGKDTYGNWSKTASVAVGIAGSTGSTGSTGTTGSAVEISAPVLVSAAAIDYNSIEVKWKAPKGAEEYRVYRKTKNGSWKRIADNVKKTTYSDDTVEIETEYIYTVRAYFRENGEKVLSGYDKNGVSAKTTLTAPTLVKATSYDYKSIKLYWKGSEGAQGYRIYRKVKGGSFKRLVDVSADTEVYIDGDSLKSGTYYVYAVRAYRIVNGDYVVGDYDKQGITKRCVPKTPSLSCSSSKSKEAALSWKKVTGANGYILYEREKGSDSWKRIKTIKSVSTLKYTASAKSGKTMEYRMRAYRKAGDENIYSSYSSAKSVKIK